MKYYTYIIYSEVLERFYTGQTIHIHKRLERHNNRMVKSTKHGVPWNLVYFEELKSRSEAMLLERKIKNR